MIHLSRTIPLDATEHTGGCSKGLFFLFVGNPWPAGSRRFAPWQPYLRLAGKSVFCRSWLFSGKSRPGHLCPFQEQLWLRSKPDKQCGPARGPLNRNERPGSFIGFAHIQSSKWQGQLVPRKSFSESLGMVQLVGSLQIGRHANVVSVPRLNKSPKLWEVFCYYLKKYLVFRTEMRKVYFPLNYLIWDDHLLGLFGHPPRE